ncbi:(2Fe-2S)-binding protein [Paenibacillus sp. NPDC057967]|uniref:(2Fe-2S)-binding protein n=1 Tax=Paenibacillus sp. NPDC057967 TaxID=3346293 RepID=UPI0036DD1395
MSQELDFSVIKDFYHISPEGADKPIFELPASGLTKAASARGALDEMGRLWKAVGMDLPTSFTGITLFNLTVMNVFFSASHNVFLRLPLNALTFQLEWHHDHAHSGYKLQALEQVCLPVDEQERKEILIREWTALFQETVIPAVNGISAAGGFKPDMIWNQFGGGMHGVIAYVRQAFDIPGLADRLDAEFAVIEGLPAEVFQRKRNPFLHKPRFIDNPWDPSGNPQMLRSSCCMYDRREDGAKCYNCPQMLPQERDERRKQVLDELAEAHS